MINKWSKSWTLLILWKNTNLMESLKKNKPFLITLAIFALTLVCLLFYFLGKGSQKKEPTVKNNITVQKDEKKDKKDEDGDEYEEGFYYEKVRVISNEAKLRRQPTNDPKDVFQNIPFGHTLYTRDREEDKDFVIVYLTDPGNVETPTEKAYFIRQNALVDSYHFEYYSKYFSIEPFKSLHSDVKRLIYENDNSSSNTYYVSQNSTRIKKAIAMGDFDSDGLGDIAIVLDNPENQYSRLLMICHNKATQKPYLAYAENFYEIASINSFKRGAKIYNQSYNLYSSENDGIILQSEGTKLAVVYDSELFKFRTISQYPEVEESSEY
jgi:hypothetical protein